MPNNNRDNNAQNRVAIHDVIVKHQWSHGSVHEKTNKAKPSNRSKKTE